MIIFLVLVLILSIVVIYFIKQETQQESANHHSDNIENIESSVPEIQAVHESLSDSFFAQPGTYSGSYNYHEDNIGCPFNEKVHRLLVNLDLIGEEVDPGDLLEGIVSGTGEKRKFVKVIADQESVTKEDIRNTLLDAKHFLCRLCCVYTDSYLERDARAYAEFKNVKVYEEEDLKEYFEQFLQNDGIFHDEYDENDEDEFDDYGFDGTDEIYDSCPLCNSRNIQKSGRNYNPALGFYGYKRFGAIGMALGEPITNSECECQDCGFLWSDE